MSQDELHIDLDGLLRGELSVDQALATGQHLDDCPECRGELAEAAVGHALLRRSASTLGGRTPVAVDLPSPPPLELPSRRPEGRGWLNPVSLAAAAVTLVVGTALVTTSLTRSEPTPVTSPPPTASPSATPEPEGRAQLRPVVGNGRGEVAMLPASATDADPHSVVMRMTVEDLPKPRPGQIYYAWLFNPKTNKMFPLGVLGRSGKATFEVPASVLGKYQSIDISLEADDGDPQHSVTSVLRGTYA